MSDHYATLGISRSASSQEIKAAYRKLALQWHPDKNPDNAKVAEEKFKEISHAFSVLGDETKRRAYDLGETEAPRHHHHRARDEEPFTFARASDIFRAFFGGRDPFADLFSMPMGFGRGPFTRMSGIFDDDDDFFSAPFGGMGLGRMGMGMSTAGGRAGGSLFDMMGGFGNMPALSSGGGFQAASFTSFSAGGPGAGAVHFEMRSTNNNGETKTYYKTVKQDANGRRIELEGTDPNSLKEHIRQLSSDQPLPRDELHPALPARDSEPAHQRLPSSHSRAGSEYSAEGVVHGRPRVAPESAYNHTSTRDTGYTTARERDHDYDSSLYDTQHDLPSYDRYKSTGTIGKNSHSHAHGYNHSHGSSSSRSRPLERTVSTPGSYRREHSPSLSKSGEHIVQGKPRYATSTYSSHTSSRLSNHAGPVTGRSRLSKY